MLIGYVLFRNVRKNKFTNTKTGTIQVKGTYIFNNGPIKKLTQFKK